MPPLPSVHGCNHGRAHIAVTKQLLLHVKTVMRCALCQEEREIRNSHIIPEFLYEPLYDEKHRLQLMSIIPSQGNSFKQKGLKEKLLCDACEQKLSVWEGYARKVLKGGVPLTIRTEGTVILIEGINYRQFKLFQLSVLWRAGVSSQQFFEYVDLGPHEEILRKQLVDEEPGSPTRYSCLMFGLKYEGDVVADLVIQPKRTKLHGQIAYNFVFGGFLWTFSVSGQELPTDLLATTLNVDGKIAIMVRSVMEMKNLFSFTKELSKLGRVP